MSIDKKGFLSQLWDKRNMSVDEFIKEASQNPDLKFLITTAGIWFLVRCFFTIWIGAHVLYLVARVFTMVLS